MSHTFEIYKSKKQMSLSNLKEEMLKKKHSWNDYLLEKIRQNNGSLNICHEALDKHLGTETEHKVAIKFIGKRWTKQNDQKNEDVQEITYGELYSKVSTLTRALHILGLRKGDVLFSLSPRRCESYQIALATMRGGMVYSPLFSAFGPEPIMARMKKGNAKALFTLSSLYHKKIAPIRNELKGLTHLIIFDDDGTGKDIPDSIDFKKIFEKEYAQTNEALTVADDLAILHFTSGTTGTPKGAMHVHAAVAYHELSGKWALDFKRNDIFWCTADPGWVTGTSYGIISPLCNGVTMLIDEAEFNARRWYEIIEHFKVTNLYSAPTAMRMLMKAGSDLPKEYDLSSIRFAASVGEPLNPEVIWWVKENLHIILHDNWWQTETGGIMISNFSSMPIRPGSMGKPLPGIEVALMNLEENNSTQKLTRITTPMQQGQIAVKKGWPAMFRGYLGDNERYQKCFKKIHDDEWYLSGDLARFDENGYFWFIGRADDVIKSAGHLIGPFEVESILMEHPAVLEAAVIGKPDEMVGEIVKAFVVLKNGFVENEEIRLDILSFARTHLGVAVAPREISFIENLPKTRSGKIMRRLLKAKETGGQPGDLSMLEAT